MSFLTKKHIVIHWVKDKKVYENPNQDTNDVDRGQTPMVMMEMILMMMIAMIRKLSIRQNGGDSDDDGERNKP